MVSGVLIDGQPCVFDEKECSNEHSIEANERQFLSFLFDQWDAQR
jgi:hypothetical protein